MDEDSFRVFVEARWGALIRTAYLLTSDAHLAEDLLQSALAKTATRWRHVSSNPEAYVRRAMYHEAVSWWRKRRVSERLSPPSALTATGEGFADAVDRRLVLRAALARLTPKQRAVLVLRFYEDCSVAEAANLLECTVGNVKRQTSHALDRLRAVAPELAEFATRVRSDAPNHDSPDCQEVPR